MPHPVCFVAPAEANNHIKNLDEELASKYDETGKHREEITSLLGQLVSQRHKIREVSTSTKFCRPPEYYKFFNICLVNVRK